MNYKILKIFTVVAVYIIIPSCAIVSVTSEYDKSVDFTQYRTFEYYGWNEGAGSLVDSNDRTVIELSFAEEFKKRDLEIIEKDADLAVSLFLVLGKRTSQTVYSNHFADGPYSNRGFGTIYGISNPAYASHDIDHQSGTLIVDVFDTKTKEPIWQGIASGAINPDPYEREQKIPKTVAKIMKEFPVKAK